MARIRAVKPSLRTSRVVAQWPREARYFWVLLWGYLDDEGRGLDIPRTILADCFPLDEDMSARTIDRWLDMMASTRRDPDRDPPLCRYEVGGVRLVHAVYWNPDNQRINRPTPSRLPPCPTHDKLNESVVSDSVSSSGAAQESLTKSSLLEGGKGGRGEVGRGEARSLSGRAQPPAPADTGGAPPPPPRTCPQHPDGTERPCRACGKARTAYEAWAAAQRGRVDEAPMCPQHRGQLASNCALCRSESIERRAS